MKNNIQNPEMQKQLYKHDHPVMYHLKELIISFYLCLGIAGIAALMMGVFHFVIGLEWGNSMLACAGTAGALLCIYLLVTFFTDGGKGKWVLRGFAIVLTLIFVTVVVMYFAYMRPTYGA